jgi:NAD(P)-dependent dehydrogenase (short-subunit alcohol dehydrogenase family)
MQLTGKTAIVTGSTSEIGLRGAGRVPRQRGRRVDHGRELLHRWRLDSGATAQLANRWTVAPIGLSLTR